MRKKIITSAIICVILSLTSTCSNPSPRHIPALSSTPCSLKSAFKDVSSHPLMGHIVFSYDGNIYISRADGSQRVSISKREKCTLSNTSCHADLLMANATGRERKLKCALVPVAEEFDYILIDTPPNLGIITINAFIAILVLPLVPSYSSVNT